MVDPVFEALIGAGSNQEPVALAVLSRAQGSTPQKRGAKAVFYPDGRIKGTLGGGCLEAEVQRRAIECLRLNRPAEFELLLDSDFGWDDGLICGGKVSGIILPHAEEAGSGLWGDLLARRQTLRWGVTEDYTVGWAPAADTEAVAGWRYVETVTPPWGLWIAGAGHIAQAVVPLAVQLDFRAVVFDDRPALANHHFFPVETGLRTGTWEQLLDDTPRGEQLPCFALVVTRGHRHDALVLSKWIHYPFAFIGMIGSARKARTIYEHFLEEKIATSEQLRRVACPAGIPIESKTVTEIAVSIMAQFVQQRARLREEAGVSVSPD